MRKSLYAIAFLFSSFSSAFAAGGCGSHDPLSPLMVFKNGTNPDGYYTQIISGLRSTTLDTKAGEVKLDTFDLGPCEMAVGDIQVTAVISSISPFGEVEIASVENPPPGATRVAVGLRSAKNFKGTVQYQYTMYINTKDCDPNVTTVNCSNKNIIPQITAALRAIQRPPINGTFVLTDGAPGHCVTNANNPFHYKIDDYAKFWYAWTPIFSIRGINKAADDHVVLQSLAFTPDGIDVTFGIYGSSSEKVCAAASVDWTLAPAGAWPP